MKTRMFVKFAQFLFVAFFVSLTVSAGAAFAADRYWVASSGGDGSGSCDEASEHNWTNTACWSDTTDGSGGSSAPGASDNVYFDGNGDEDCTAAASKNVASLTFAAAYTSDLSFASNLLDVDGDLLLAGGVNSSIYANDIEIEGNFQLGSNTTYTESGGTIEFNGSEDSNINGWNYEVKNLIVNKDAETDFVNLPNGFTSNGTVTITEGTLDNRYNSSVVFDILTMNGGKFTAGAGAAIRHDMNTRIYTGATYDLETSNITTGTSSSYSFEVDGGTLSAGTGNVSIGFQNSYLALTLKSGTITAPSTGKTLQITGGLKISGGTFNPGLGKIEFNGSVGSVIDVNSTQSFYDVDIYKGNNTTNVGVSGSDVVTVDNNLWLSQGRLSNTGELVAAKDLDWMATFGGANPTESGPGNLRIKTEGDETIGSGTVNLPRLTIDGTNLDTGTDVDDVLTVDIDTNGDTYFWGKFHMVAVGLNAIAFDNSIDEDIRFEGDFEMDAGTFNAGGTATVGERLIDFEDDINIDGGTFNLETSEFQTSSYGYLTIEGEIFDGSITAFADYGSEVSGTVKATSVGHGLSTGTSVVISDTTNYDGTFLITKIDNDNFYFTDTWVSDDGTGSWTTILVPATFNAENGEVDINSTNSTFGLEIKADGTFTAPTAGRYTYIQGGMRMNGGTFTPGTGNVRFDGSTSSTVDVSPDTDEFYNIEMAKDGSYSTSFSDTTYPVEVTNKLTLESGYFAGGFAGGILEASNEVDWQSGFGGVSSVGTSGFIRFNTGDSETINLGDATVIPGLIIETGDVTLVAGTQTEVEIADDFIMNGGTFSNSTDVDLRFDDPFTMNGGTFNAGPSNPGPGPTITLDVRMDLDGGIFDLKRATLESYASSSYWVSVDGGTLNASEGNLHINGTSSYASLELLSGVISAPAGSRDFFIYGGLDIAAGLPDNSFIHNGGTVTIKGSIGSYLDHNSYANNKFNNLTLDKDDVSDNILLDSPLYLEGSMDIQGGNLDVGSADYDIELEGDWTMAASNVGFDYEQGNVIFGAGDHSIIGDTTFYDLTKDTNSTLTFAAGSTTTITGTWTAKGTSTSDRLNLRSDTPGSEWYIDPQGTRDIAFLDVQDSHNTSGTTIDARGTGSVPASPANNDDWLFDSPPVISNLGPATLVNGSYVYDDTPQLSFDIDDPNDENVNYQIQVDDTSNAFASLVVDQTGAYATEGSFSYTTASLSDGTYYWRVRSTNQSGGQTSEWSVANGGAVAFGIDTTDVTQVSPIGGTLSDTTPLFTWQDVSYDATYTVEVTTSADTGFASPVLTMTGIAQNSTTKEATSSLAPGDYIWRVYGIDGLGTDSSAGASSASFSLLNVIPEFPTYLLGALMVIGFGFVLRKRINFTEMS